MRLSLGKEDGTEEVEAEVKRFAQKYISALCENIDARFNPLLPVLTSVQDI